VSHRTTLRTATMPVSRDRSTPPRSPRTLRNTRARTHKVVFSVSIRQNFICPSCVTLLTVLQELEQHLHLGQGGEAGEVCPLRATGPGRLLPASSLRLRQQPIADAIVRPPAVTTLCVDILPVLCGSRKTNRERRRNHNRKDPKKREQIHSRHCFGLATDRAMESERSEVNSPGAAQLLRTAATRAKLLVHLCALQHKSPPLAGRTLEIQASKSACQVVMRCVPRMLSPSGSALRVSLGVFLQMYGRADSQDRLCQWPS